MPCLLLCSVAVAAVPAMEGLVLPADVSPMHESCLKQQHRDMSSSVSLPGYSSSLCGTSHLQEARRQISSTTVVIKSVAAITKAMLWA